MSKHHGANPLVGQLKFRYGMLLFWVVVLLGSSYVTKDYLATNVVDILGMTPTDATAPLTNREAMAILGKQDWFSFLDGFKWFAIIPYQLSFLAFIYKLWDILPPHRARMTPLKATLPLLVPIFNVYWLFVCVLGFVKDANKLLLLRSIENRNINADVAVCMCVTPLLMSLVVAPSGIAVFGEICILFHMVFVCMFASQANAAALAIAKTNRSHVPDRQPLMERNVPIAAEKSA